MNRVTLLTVIAVLALLVGATGLGLGIEALNKKAGVGNRPEVATLRQELAIAKTEIAAAQSKAAEAYSEDSQLNGKLNKLLDCVPELLNMISSLTPEVSEGKVFLKQGASISTYCQPVFY